MSVWKRSLLYIRRHKFRNFILLLILIIVAAGMMIGITVWQGSRNGMKELQKTYGNSFTIKAIIPKSAEDERLWEQVGKVPGYPQYRYKGSLVNDELIERIMKVDGVTEYCKEAHLSLAYFPEIDLIDGGYAADVKFEKETGEVVDPSGIYQPLVSERENRVNGCSSSELLNYFRSNALEIIDGRPIREGDKHQILISDELAERNHLAVGDQILVTQLFYPTLDKIRVTDETEMPVIAEEYLTIVGLFHVNVSQYINEMTVEDDIAGNYMFADIGSVTELYRENGEAYGEAIDPEYTVTFFINDPARMDEIIENVKEIPGVEWSDYDIQIETSLYESALKPLENVSKISTFLIIFLLIVSIVLLILILRIWIGGRKKEMGILISIGETKGKIRGQIMLEGGILLLGALILAAGITMWSGGRIGNALLDQMNAREEQSSKKEPMEFPTDLNGLEEYNEQFEIHSEAEPVEKIACGLGAAEFLACGAVLYIVLLFVVWIETKRIIGRRCISMDIL